MRAAPPASLDGIGRIVCYGVTGSGKTTLAARLGELTGLPWHEADRHTWEPGWVQVPEDEQRRRIERLVGAPQWILDTAYGSWIDVVLPRADLVIALDYDRWLTLVRLLRRTVLRLVDRHEVCNGNTESLRNLFGGNSIVRWHFASFSRKRARMAAWEADPAAPPVLRFRSPRETEAWLARLAAPAGR